MSLHSTAVQLATLAAEGGEHGGDHESLSPYIGPHILREVQYAQVAA